MGKLPEYHVLNFFYDDNGCSLTALVKGQIYHITVDQSDLQDRSKAGKRVAREYRKRLEQSKDDQVDDDGKETAPLFVQEDEDPESDEAKDSAVDVDENDDDESPGEPSTALERWMLSPLKDVFSKKSSKASKKQNVEDWYHCPTHYFQLRIEDGKLQAQPDDIPSTTTQKRTHNLIPSMPLPKYLRDLEVPMISAETITVLHESDDPAPIHPALVQHKNTQYFLKIVDNTQHAPLKRELQVMKRIESQNLHNEIRVPLLRGLVHFSNTPDNIMGFIMDAIPSPTPLTKMLDSGVAEDKRLKWADEAARMVDVLHQHGIIWGDAKGDNLIVDKQDELWIIDFGGSYTEGWVDPELKETAEGDKQGFRKVWNGLVDPDENTVDPEEEEEQAKGEASEEEVEETRALRREVESCRDWEDNCEKSKKKSNEKSSKKRKVDDCGDWEGSYEKSSQQRKTKDDGTPRYCQCGQPESGRMLACDGEKCEKQWFHFACVGIEEAPSEKKWYCDECKKQ